MDNASGKYGYVNDQGQFVIAPQFDYAMRFSGPYAVVQQQGLYGYVDLQGKVVVEPKYRKVGGFSEDRFRVQRENDGLWTFLNEKGKPALKASYYYAGNFYDGLAVFAEKKENGENRYGYIDKKGKVVVEAVYGYAYDIKDGFGRIALDLSSEEPRYGYIDAKGELVVPCVFNEWMAENQLLEYKARHE